MKNKKVKRESFQAHFAEDFHQGESDCKVQLINPGVSVDDLTRRECYWQHELEIFHMNGLNERKGFLFYLGFLSHIPTHIVF